jgi:DNA invertase Pin-like site-specific DNA recombinase
LDVLRNQNRAWIYTRIDAPEDSHGALKSQERELRDYAEQLNLNVVGCSSDCGTEHFALREGFAKTFIAAENGEYDALIVREFSRIAPLNEAAGILQHLKKYGVSVLSPREGDITAKMGGGSGA